MKTMMVLEMAKIGNYINYIPDRTAKTARSIWFKLYPLQKEHFLI